MHMFSRRERGALGFNRVAHVRATFYDTIILNTERARPHHLRMSLRTGPGSALFGNFV